MKKIILLGICIVLLVGFGYNFNLSDYEEVCYQYQIDYTYETHCRCVANFQYANYCNTECCHCPEYGKKYYNITNINITNECIEYHLVRKVN